MDSYINKSKLEGTTVKTGMKATRLEDRIYERALRTGQGASLKLKPRIRASAP